MKVTLIHNPDAGSDDQPSGDELLELIRRAGHEPTYRSSKAKDWDTALEEPSDLVAVAGGDGIVGKVAKRLVGKHTPIAVLPMGTANNIARTLGMMDAPLQQSIAGWSTARRKNFDAGVATGPWGSTHFIEGLGIGLFTEMMTRLDGRGNVDLAHLTGPEEKITTVLQMLQVRLSTCAEIELNITMDGLDLSGEYVLFEVMNIKSVGPNLFLAPKADPGDGFLDIVCLTRGAQEKLSQCMAECEEDNPIPAGLPVRRGKSVHIEWEGSPIHIDDQAWPDKGGSFPPSSTVIDITLESGVLDFLTP
ncbi:MAG: diacylglycerol kinase family protein [Candidatus Binatia bacterium]